MINTMYKELPEYVFNKKYDFFYLLTEYDIIFNQSFTNKMLNLLNEINTTEVIINLQVPEVYKSSVNEKIIINSKNLNDFYEMEAIIGKKKIPYYMINFFINDDSKNWEIYTSLENEVGIIACSNKLKFYFDNIFDPYCDENLNKKIKIIGDMFSDEKTKLEFFQQLEKNYKFR